MVLSMKIECAPYSYSESKYTLTNYINVEGESLSLFNKVIFLCQNSEEAR